MAQTVRFSLNDGTKLEADPSGPFTAREQIAWEEHFKQSFVTIYRAMHLDRKLLGDDPDATAQHYQVSWVLWFAWHRLRPKVSSRFSTFIDEQLEDWEFIGDEEPDGEEDADGGEDGGLDPTSGPPADSTPDP